ncbi:MAG: hypothetical protein LT080_03235 [Thiobacillus sp.]|nr:hypothetical protein [Thiobacillus sp.]
MNRMLWIVAAAGLMVSSGAALGAADKPCYKVDAAPDTMEGQVIKVDSDQGRLTMRAADGSTHEFVMSQETLAEYKVGDAMKAKLKAGQRCE